MILFVDLGTYYAIAGTPFPGQGHGPRILSKNTARFKHGDRLDLFDTDLGFMIEGFSGFKTHKAHNATAVYFERVHRHDGTDAAHLWGAFYGILALRCNRAGLPLYGVPVQDIKEHATGHRGANKAAMIAMARQQGWGDLVNDGTPAGNDNAADALWGLSLCEKVGHLYHGGTKAAQRRNAEAELTKRAVGGTGKPKRIKP